MLLQYCCYDEYYHYYPCLEVWCRLYEPIQAVGRILPFKVMLGFLKPRYVVVVLVRGP